MARGFMLVAMKPISLFLVSLTGIVLTVASAAPAPYYKWTSRVDTAVVCSQTPLGPGWVQGDGPFSDSRCLKRLPTK